MEIRDIQMPEMDGYAATESISKHEQENPGKHRAVIIALTANALQKDIDKCLAAGCDGYLSKPIKKTVLLQSIRTYF